jgi:23S rRNA (cytosine1962-C5)-methyltransferase
MQASVILRPDREKPIIQHHPWVFSGGIRDITGDPQAGYVVDVLAADGRWLARGFYSPLSQIRVRIASRQPDQPLDEAWLRGALQRAVAGRAALISAENSACRLVYSESDGIPGLIVDRYGRWLVVQLSTQGLARRAELVFDLLEELLHANSAAPEGGGCGGAHIAADPAEVVEPAPGLVDQAVVGVGRRRCR